MPIAKLPNHIITKIAAGQVIERPAYAVKELIENALDANATQIHVEIEQAGLRQITVRDNGHGMSKEDLRESYKHHTTSKIQEENDLTHIHTMGFRGEALASLASMSDLTIQSKEQESVSGYQVILKNGELEEFSSIGMPEGTTVDVQDLFGAVPARKKFLKTAQTEFRHIVDVVSAFALGFPQVGFQLMHNGKHVLTVPKNQVMDERVAEVMGSSLAEQLMPIRIGKYEQPENPYVHLHGFISRPQVSFGSAKQFLFVNNRRVDNTAISFAIKNAYGSLLEPRQYPVVVLFLSIPYEMVDVNIDPRKEEARFHNHADVIETVQQAVSRTLENENLTYSGFNPGHGLLREKPTQSYAGRTLKQDVTPWTVKDLTSDNDTILQIHNTFLIVQTKKGMMMIDQHAAHERILYEQFLQAFQEKKQVEGTSELEKPVLLHLSASDSELIDEHKDTLSLLGFTIEQFGDNSWNVSAVPRLFQDRDIHQLLLEVLEDLAGDAHTQTIDMQTNALLSYLACRTAIKAGDVLTQNEMRRLIEKLTNTKTQYTCPHGRPVKVEMELKELYRLFKRK